MTFGWYGWTFEHPDDWAPTLLSGDRREGFVRLNGPGGEVCGLRWSTGKGRGDTLEKYRAQLAKEARKAKKPLRFEGDEEGFKYDAGVRGRGRILRAGDRAAIVEVRAETTRKLDDRPLTTLADGETWAVLGLISRFADPQRLVRRQFYSGRTVLELRGKGTETTIERWGLADTLLRGRTLLDWSVARVNDGRLTARETEDGVVFDGASLLRKRRVLVRHDAAENRILLADVLARRPDRLPEDPCSIF